MAIEQTDQRLFKGTTAQILAFVPPPFDGWTYAESTDDNSAYRWNDTTGTWGQFGAPPILFGQLGIPSAVNPISGNRPLAAATQIGSIWTDVSRLVQYINGLHPSPGRPPGTRMWKPITQAQNVMGLASAAGTAVGRAGVFDPSNSVFTQATVQGQFCNATATTTTAGGLSLRVSLKPVVFQSIALAIGIQPGVEWMTNSSGILIPYVAGPNIVPIAMNGLALNHAVETNSAGWIYYDND